MTSAKKFWDFVRRTTKKVNKWPYDKRKAAAYLLLVPYDHSHKVACHSEYGCDEIAQRNEQMLRSWLPEDFE